MGRHLRGGRRQQHRHPGLLLAGRSARVPRRGHDHVGLGQPGALRPRRQRADGLRAGTRLDRNRFRHGDWLSGQLLAAQSKDTYTVVVHATVTSALDTALAPCAAAGAGHGYFNAAVLTSGSDRFDAQACAPITPLSGPAPSPTPPSAPSNPTSANTPGTLPFTGLALRREVLFGVALCAIGTAFVLVSRRRRSRRALSHGV